ncbi:MAG TPA: hypothetical protein EYP35_06100 [Desulfobacterales bacterium]|nr:hypothetical protein [Desulfobacterales bacterium]
MGFFRKKTTQWKQENGLRSINFCMPISLLQELDWWKKATGTNRSEIIRAGIRMYIREKKSQLADQEKKELEAWQIKQQNQRRQVNTGLLPDF